MKFLFSSTIDYFSRNPRILFFLDGLGAGLTTCCLFFVMRNYLQYFGMPSNILTSLSIVGLVYCCYSFSCFFLIKENWQLFLRIIAIGNFLYCVSTIILVYLNYSYLTLLGMTYFLAEIIIIVGLLNLEWRVANKKKIN